MKFVFRSLTLIAGARKRVDEVASFFMLVSNTGDDNIKISIDNDPLSQCPVGYEYTEKKEDEFFSHIDFQNPNVGAVTIEYIMSTGLVRSSPSITGFDEMLTELETHTTELEKITAELQGISTAGTDGAEKTVGVAQGSILAVNTSRKAFNLQAKSTNTGIIYLGFTNAVTSAIWFAELQPGQACMIDDYRGPVFGIATVAAQKLGWGEW